MIRRWLLPLSLLLIPAAVSATCYNPDGTDRNVGLSLTPSNEEWYQPCANAISGEHRMCCRTTDTCRFDGLCTNKGLLTVWRESCTDKTWQDPNCLKLCAGTAIGYNGRPNNATDVPITICDDGSMCCGTKDYAASCCANKQGFFIASDSRQVYAATATGTQTPIPSSTSTSTHTHLPSSTSTKSPPDSKPTNTPPPSKETPLAAILGGVIGGISALALLIGGIIYIRRRRARDQDDNATLVGSPYQYFGYVKPHGDAQEVLVVDRFQEMRGYRGSAQELDGQEMVHMLDSNLGGMRKDSNLMRGRLGWDGHYRI